MEDLLRGREILREPVRQGKRTGRKETKEETIEGRESERGVSDRLCNKGDTSKGVRKVNLRNKGGMVTLLRCTLRSSHVEYNLDHGD